MKKLFLFILIAAFGCKLLIANDSLTIVYATNPPSYGKIPIPKVRTTGSALSAEEIDSLKVDFKVEKSKATRTKKAEILYIEQVVEDSTGVITTTRIPIKDSLVAVNFIEINLAKIDSTSKQIDTELERLNQMTDIIRQQFEQIRQQRVALIERRITDAQTRRELEKLRGKL